MFLNILCNSMPLMNYCYPRWCSRCMDENSIYLFFTQPITSMALAIKKNVAKGFLVSVA